MQQQKEMLEAALNTVSIGYEGANKYKVRVAHKSIVAARHCWVSPTLSRTRLTQVRDPAGRPMYFVVEDSGCCSRQCCNPNHSMTLQVTDMTGERVMTITMDHDAIICFMTDGLARGLALSSKPPLRAFTATRRHPLAPTGSRGPTPAPG